MTIHEETQPKYWEPVTFKVGDRVRVRLSGECTEAPALGCTAQRLGQPLHEDDENHLTGTIIDDDTVIAQRLGRDSQVRIAINYYRSIGHTYNVLFDEAAPTGITVGAYAAAELELIEAVKS